MIERTHLFNFRISEDERAKLQALADAESDDVHASALVRRWIRQHYEARFGNVAPAKIARASGSKR